MKCLFATIQAINQKISFISICFVTCKEKGVKVRIRYSNWSCEVVLRCHTFFFLLSRPIWCTDSFQRLMTSSIFGECIQIEWKNIQINMITDCFFLAATLCCAQCNADLFTTEIFNLSPPVGVQNGFCLHEKCIGSIVFVLLLCLHLCRPGRIGKLITRSLF